MIKRGIPVAAILFACGGVVVPAKADWQLAGIDNELSSLCGQIANAGASDASALRARLAATWKQRAVYLATLPPGARAAAQGESSLSASCMTLARKTAAVPSARTKHYRTYGKKPTASIAANEPTTPAPVTPAASTLHQVPVSATVSEMELARGHVEAPVAPTFEAHAARIAPLDRGTRQIPGGVNSSTITGPTAASPSPPPPAASVPAPPLSEFFPWPPPTPSGRALIDVVKLGGGTAATNWGQLADQLRGLLKQFSSWGFYSAPGGFALITQIEQLDDQTGKALAGNGRWVADTQVAGSGNFFVDIFTIKRPKGLYRVFVFLLTTDTTAGGPSTDPQKLLQIARQWGIRGSLDLPQESRSEAITAAHRLYMMVYEFESTVGGDTAVDAPGHFSLNWHLGDAGIVLPP